ncbi:MAG: efflux RND transporter periplasmic adaptor subunit [Balneolaceae bacterium]
MRTKTVYPKQIAPLLLGLLLLVSCGEESQSEEREQVRTVAVETMVVDRLPFSDQIRLSGVVEAVEDATISAENSGRIQSIVDRGDRVRQADVIAVMDNRLSQAQYAAAQTGYELAEDTFSRLERLYGEEIISTQDYLSARAQRDQARAQLEQAEKQLEDTEIKAPFSGRIEERFVQIGELAAPGAPVVQLVNTDRLHVAAGVPERYSGQIAEGAPVELVLRTLGTEPIQSEVTFAGNLIDPGTRTFPIEVRLSSMEGRVKPEMVVDLRIRRATLEEAIIVPRTALIRDEESIYLFVAVNRGEDKTAELREVHTGVASGSLIQITSGLESGDEVVIAGLSTLNTGDHLQIVGRHEASDWIEEARNEID